MTRRALILEATTETVVGHLAGRIASCRQPLLAIPGGRTPVPVLRTLAREVPAWRSVELTLTDDRLVDPRHPASDFGVVSRLLGTSGARLMPLEEGAFDRMFDLVWCGMGADGHVASILPDPNLPDDDAPAVVRVVPDPLPEWAPYARLTCNLAALTRTRELMVVIDGDEKRRVVERALDGDTGLPIGRLIARARCPITIFWNPR